MWQSKQYIKSKIYYHNKNMSSLTYYKMLTVGQKLKKNINTAKKVCAQKPKSQECKVAWDHVNEYQVKHLVELEEQLGVELSWENYDM